MTFEDIQKVNEGLKTTEIKGNSYVEVNQRIKAFRQLFPDGFIKTDLVSLEDGMCVIKATVGMYDKYLHDVDGEKGWWSTTHDVILATGYAYEKEQSSYINKTSFIENCETSAVGRALGMLGIGIDTSVASAEEVRNAINQQEMNAEHGKAETKAKAQKAQADDPIISSDKVEIAVATIRNKQTTLANVLKAYGVEKLADLRESQYQNLMKRLSATADKE